MVTMFSFGANGKVTSDGSCTRQIDPYTSVTYTWDCCGHGGKATGVMTVKGVPQSPETVLISDVGCYSDCCVPTN